MGCIPVDERCIQLSSSRHRAVAALRKIPLFSVRTAGNGGKDKPSAPGRAGAGARLKSQQTCGILPYSQYYLLLQTNVAHVVKVTL
jgi:hypothetical protein